MKPIAWYDPSNGMVSTDQDCPLFTPLGQVWGLYLKEEAKDEPVAWRAWVSKFPQGTGSDWVYVTKPIMKDSVHNQPLYTTPPQRTWVGLTKEERHKISMDNRPYCADIMAAHEEELKRRNT